MRWWFRRDEVELAQASQAMKRESKTHAELMELVQEATRLSRQLVLLPDSERDGSGGRQT
jgi:hypothetical protein